METVTLRDLKGITDFRGRKVTYYYGKQIYPFLKLTGKTFRKRPVPLDDGILTTSRRSVWGFEYSKEFEYENRSKKRFRGYLSGPEGYNYYSGQDRSFFRKNKDTLRDLKGNFRDLKERLKDEVFTNPRDFLD